jgi:hypothetical protein
MKCLVKARIDDYHAVLTSVRRDSDNFVARLDERFCLHEEDFRALDTGSHAFKPFAIRLNQCNLVFHHVTETHSLSLRKLTKRHNNMAIWQKQKAEKMFVWLMLQCPKRAPQVGRTGEPNRRREPRRINSLRVSMVEIADSRRLHHRIKKQSPARRQPGGALFLIRMHADHRNRICGRRSRTRGAQQGIRAACGMPAERRCACKRNGWSGEFVPRAARPRSPARGVEVPVEPTSPHARPPGVQHILPQHIFYPVDLKLPKSH